MRLSRRKPDFAFRILRAVVCAAVVLSQLIAVVGFPPAIRLDKDMEKFRELGATVLAVSADPSEQTRERFRQYGAFSFAVLSDPSNEAAKLYSTVKPAAKPGEEGDLMHGTFVIGQTGRVEWANRGAEPFTENRTLLVELNRARNAGMPK